MSEITNEQQTLLDQESWHQALKDHVQAAYATGNPLSVLFIDLNNFKRVNDTLGHNVGDEVLDEIKNVINSPFYVGGRIGGDEFGVAAETDEAGIEEVKLGLRAAFSEYVNRPENNKLRELELGAAIGTATLEPGMDSSMLLKEADEAMYEDKLDQLPELTDDQFVAVTEARLALSAVGLRLRDLEKYERKLGSEA